MRRPKFVVEAAHKRIVFVVHSVAEHAEHLFGKRPFIYAVQIEHRRLRRPADVHRRIDVLLCPLEYTDYFAPILDVGKFEMFDRRAGYYETIEAHILFESLVERHIESLHVLLIRVLGGIRRRPQQNYFHLQRSISYEAQKLRLGRRLVRHEIQNGYFQRTDLL